MSTTSATIPLDPDACYKALQAHDARFDGGFFTGVSSTGIYCRPVCRVKTPKRDNCRFFRLAAQAEQAGFRPCLRCRPELAPGSRLFTPAWSIQDASLILAQQAIRLLEDPDAWPDQAASVARLASRLGISDRHLRRLFEQHLGVSPLQYLLTRRLLTAKQLLTDTELPVQKVALHSGFSSVRRFHAAFSAYYRLQPLQLRQSRRQGSYPEPGLLIRLPYRPPLDTAALLGFWQQRQVSGLEAVDLHTQTLTRTLALQHHGQTLSGWLSLRFDPHQPQVLLQLGGALQAALPKLIGRSRGALDLDADPQAIASVLEAEFPGISSLRVPGAFDGFELAIRAILGQQITVAAARTLTQRLVHQFGQPLNLANPWQLQRLFPSPETLATTPPQALGELGIVRLRQRAIIELSKAVAQGELQLSAGAPLEATLQQLRSLPGIGDWTAQYIAMRALRWPDAFPSGDVVLQQRLGLRPQASAAAEAISRRWSPWRSYAVIRLWQISTKPHPPSSLAP